MNIVLKLLKISVIISFVSCQGFYDKSRVGDVYRIPLVQPLELRSYSHGDSWHLNLPYKGIKNLTEISDVKFIGISDSIIVVYVDRIYVPEFSKMTEAWFIVDMHTKKEYVFDDKETYEKNIENLGKSRIELLDVNDVFFEFDTHEKLPDFWVKK